MSQTQLPVVRSLWIGPELSALERLALRSFLHCGHRVELFTYADVAGVPEGVRLRDGNEVLSERDIFRHRESDSVAAFSDWFRYRMLFQEGGFWVDTDVICLKPFDFEVEVVFGRQEHDLINCAVLGGPGGHPLFELLMRQAESPNDFLPFDTRRDRRRKLKRRLLQGNHRGNLKWGEIGPHALTRAARYLGLDDLALPYTAFYPIHPLCWDAIFDSTYPSPEEFFPRSFALHLWNEMFRSTADFSKNGPFAPDSLIGALCRRYPE